MNNMQEWIESVRRKRIDELYALRNAGLATWAELRELREYEREMVRKSVGRR